MNRARAALLVPLATLLAFPIAPPEARAGQGRGPLASTAGHAPRDVVLIVEDKVSFEQLMAVAVFRRLAAAGGAALMTTRTRALADSEQGPESVHLAYLTIADGTEQVPTGGGRPVLNELLLRRRIRVCAHDVSALSFGNPTGELAFGGPSGPFRCGPPLAAKRPAMAVVDSGSTFEMNGTAGVARALRTDGREVADVLRSLGAVETLVVVLSPSTSSAMDRVGDQVTPLVMASGRANRLLAVGGPAHALTSATTRTDGIVANVDVAPTILRWLAIPVPSSMDGGPITIGDGSAPFALHRLHLEQRRARLPVDLGVVAFIAALGLVGIALLVRAGRGATVGAPVAGAMRFLVMAATALLLVLLGGGLLPRMTYAWVVPYLVLATAGLAALSLLVPWPRPFGPFLFLGAVALGFVLIDSLFGGNAFRMPLYGSTIFDGARFYGLSNSFIALVLASALFLALALAPRPGAGAVLLFATGLWMGFPRLGVNIGGSVTLFAAAGAWWAVSGRRGRRGRAVAWGVLIAVAVVLAGAALVLAANRYLPGTPTHATRFVERSTGNAGFGIDTFRRRLGVGFSQFGHVPAAYVPILGLPVLLALTLRGPGTIGAGLRRHPRWRDALVTLILASAVAYFANDTGVAAAAPAFLYAMAMLLYPALALASSPRPRRGLSRPLQGASR